MASVGHGLRAPGRAKMGSWAMGRVGEDMGGQEWPLRPMVALGDITTSCSKDTGDPQGHRHSPASKTL